MIPICASELREKPFRHKREMIERHVEPIYQKVLHAANTTTSLYYDIDQTIRENVRYNIYYKKLTPEEERELINNVVRVLKEYLIDCDIAYTTKMVNEQEKTGIYIDWS